MCGTLQTDPLLMAIYRYLPGCNAIFLEVSSAEKVTMKQDVVDPRMRHTIYHQIGFRLIDCEYIAPPLSPSFSKLKDLFLTVYPNKRKKERKIEKKKKCRKEHWLLSLLSQCNITKQEESFSMIVDTRKISNATHPEDAAGGEQVLLAELRAEELHHRPLAQCHCVREDQGLPHRRS